MKHQKFSRAAGLLMIALAFSAIGFSGCKIVVDKLADTYTGESLFEGIFRSNGDVLGFDKDMQEQVQRYLETDRQKQAFLKFEKEVLGQLVKDHSDFAREFYNKMHSNNRDKVREALEDAGKLVEKELKELTGEDGVTAEAVVKYALGKYDVDEE